MKSWHSQKKRNKKAAFAGKFYPVSKQELNFELNNLFNNARKISYTKYQLQALISPHAGYVFSGEVAASAFNQIPENANYKRVFIIASSHQFYFKGASVYNLGNYETPLGEIMVDINLANHLIDSSDLFQEKTDAHEFEHSLEVQLPFLQHKLKNNFLLIPIILGTENTKECKELAQILQPWFTTENLFVISTDFSHYPEYNDANKVDYITADAICRNKTKKLLNILKENKKIKIKNLATSLCGWTSVLTLLYLTEGENVLYEKIEYKNSGDSKIYGEKNRVVGYWAIGVFNKNEKYLITETDKKKLLEKARFSITPISENRGKRNNFHK